MAWFLEVRDPADLTVKLTIDPVLLESLTKDVEWRDPYRGIGTLRFRLHNDEADLVERGDIVAAYVDDEPRVVFIVDHVLRHSIAKGGGSTLTEYTCTTAKTAGKRSKVQPSLGLGARPKEFYRHFDWTSPLFDDSAWDTATEIIRVDSLTSAHWVGLPADYPYEQAYWIGPDDGDDDNAPDGVYFLRATFDTDGGNISIFAAADNDAIVYLDGQRVMSVDTFQVTRRYDAIVSAGTHQLAVFARNYVQAVTNPTGVVLTVIQTGPDGSMLEVLRATDDTWKILVRPAQTPGMPIGQSIGILHDEATGRNELPMVTLGFTDTLDSAGAAWPVVTDVGVRVGDSFTDFLLALEDTYIDFDVRLDIVTPALVVDAWNRGTRGNASGSTFAAGTNIRSLHHEEPNDRITALLIEWADGWTEVDSGANPRLVEYVAVTQVNSEDAAQRVGQAILDDRSLGRTRYLASTVDTAGATAYTDYLPGDTASVPDADLAASTQLVQAINCTVGPTGRLKATPEFGEPVVDIDTAKDKAVRRVSASVLEVNVATPAAPIPGGGGSVYSMLRERFSMDTTPGTEAAAASSQKTPSRATRDVFDFQLQLDETSAHDVTAEFRVNGTAELTVTVAAGSLFARTSSAIGAVRVTQDVDVMTVAHTTAAPRWVATVRLR